MNKQCEIVQDLLPLYVDKVCSNASSQLIEEHLPECPACTTVHNNLMNGTCENSFKAEAKSVIEHHVKTQKKKTLLLGTCISGILCIPVIVCLIVNLAVGHALDWFFVVASSVLFGLSVIFIPYIAYKAPLNTFWKRNKGLLILGTTTILLFVMLFCIGVFVSNDEYWEITPPITLFFVGIVWLIFLICKYFKVSKCVRAGLVSIIVGGVLFSANNVINLFIEEDLPWPALNLNTWNINTVDGNIKWLMLITGVVVGVVLIVVGVVRKNNNR